MAVLEVTELLYGANYHVRGSQAYFSPVLQVQWQVFSLKLPLLKAVFEWSHMISLLIKSTM